VRGCNPNQKPSTVSGEAQSVAVDAKGIPLGWVIDGANRNDSILLAPTLDAVEANAKLTEIETLHLDRGYDSGVTRERLAAAGITDAVIQLRGTKVPGAAKQPLTLGLRWIVEATNSWWSNYGQLRRNTDRKTVHRDAALSLATVILMVSRLLDYRDRWSTA
jgi:IS5 family transposase